MVRTPGLGVSPAALLRPGPVRRARLAGLSLAAGLLGLWAPAWGADGAGPDRPPVDPLGAAYQATSALLPLPPQAAVQAQLQAQPSVRQALAQQAQALAVGRRLRAGPYEWSLRLGTQQRREQPGSGLPDQRYREPELGLESSLRWPDKVRADEALAQLEARQAELALADAWHEAGRQLLSHWFDWLREHRSVSRLREQAALAEQQWTVLKKRVQSGEASRLELWQTEAEWARLEAAQAQAAQREQVHLLVLNTRYPGLVPLARHVVACDCPVPGPSAAWRARILEDNHELELAEAQAALQRQHSLRARLDRRPDPLLGVRSSRERGGQDQLLGAYLVLPLGGAGRQADEAAAEARARAAEARADEVRVRVRSEADKVSQAAVVSLAIWRQLRHASEALQRSAELAQKAYALGELPLSEALQSRRLAIEALLATESAGLDMQEAQSRLLLDAHWLWPLEEGHAHSH